MTEEAFRRLEERVAHLEKELERVKVQMAKEPEKTGWQAIVGSHKGSKMFEEILREGRRIRQADRPKANGGGRTRENAMGQTQHDTLPLLSCHSRADRD